jgi:hypothetical protein
MRTTLLSILCVLAVQMQSLGQGTILFNTHVPGIVDSKWVFDDMPPSYYAQFGTDLALLIGPGQFQRLYPTTTLITSPASEVGYVEPVTVTVPNHAPGERVTLSTGIFYLSNPNQTLGSWDTTITLGGGGAPPAYLTGLPAEMSFVPELPPATLLVFASVPLLLITQSMRWRTNQGITRRMQ